ncbi:BAI1-associated protein 3 [Bulinus truncatus]|nr:BAI1-associated protein 3 [Bulinus truncatus]
MEHPLSYDLLHDLLLELDRLYRDGTLSREEEETLAESFTNFIEYSKSLLRKMRDVYPPTNRTAITRLRLMLKCLSTIHNLQIFKKCCPFHSGLNSEIMSLVKKSTLEWYERAHSTYMGHTKNDEDLLRGLIELCNQLNSDVFKAYHSYNPLFVELCSVQYFQVTYKQLERALGEEINLDIEKILKANDVHHEPSGLGTQSLTLNTGLFELYMNLQEFSRYSRHLSASDIKQLSIINYYHWFKCAVSKWLTIAQHRAERRIKKAVELEKVAQVDAAVKYSTSAVDVCCCFTQITEFWKQLAWPDRVGAYPFVYKLTEDICNGAKLYADLVHTKLTDMGYYDDEGQFDVTEELCITINNIEQVRRALKPLPTLLDFSEIQQALELARDDPHPPKEATTGLLGKASLQGIIKQADEDMIRKILQVVDRVADKMRPDIKKDVFHLNWAPESLPAEEAVEDLLEYLDSNLLTLNSNLLKTNFERILSSIWVEVLEEFREVLDTEEMRPPVFYQRMFQALSLLVDFFYANGNGLEMEAILIESFENLRKELTMHKMDTKSLIETFYMEKNEQQAHTQTTEYGQLQIRAVYKYDSHKLLVEVLSAKDLIPLDANGLSDPYVLVSLVPEHVFPGVSTQSTKIVKKTLNPVFDESFEFGLRYAGGEGLVYPCLWVDKVLQLQSFVTTNAKLVYPCVWVDKVLQLQSFVTTTAKLVNPCVWVDKVLQLQSFVTTTAKLVYPCLWVDKVLQLQSFVTTTAKLVNPCVWVDKVLQLQSFVTTTAKLVNPCVWVDKVLQLQSFVTTTAKLVNPCVWVDKVLELQSFVTTTAKLVYPCVWVDEVLQLQSFVTTTAKLVNPCVWVDKVLQLQSFVTTTAKLVYPCVWVDKVLQLQSFVTTTAKLVNPCVWVDKVLQLQSFVTTTAKLVYPCVWVDKVLQLQSFVTTSVKLVYPCVWVDKVLQLQSFVECLCAHHGATLTFTVMDHDLLFQNDFGGEAFLPLADVHGVGGEEISGYDVLNVITLPLIHPKASDRGALNVLRRRTWDTTAQDFVKKRNLIEQQAK